MSRTCLECGADYTAQKRTARFCSKACGKRAWKKAHREIQRASNRASYQKNRESKLDYSRRYYEANRERKAEWVARWQEANPDKVLAAAARWREANPGKQAEASARWAAANPEAMRAMDQRRRARLRRGQVESFKDGEIFERDRWRCQLCGGRVSRRLRHPDPLSPSLDHVVPLSDGGAHIRANVQLAHLRCNLSKGPRKVSAGEQLRLVG